jgi:putative flippase GtrA
MPSTVKQASKFGLVGIFNTALDFAIFNLGHSVFGLGTVTANVISTTIAMIVSYMINRNFVFSGSSSKATRQAILFLIVTAIGLYVLQNGVIYLVTTSILHSNGIVASNIAKLIGTGASLVWNFILYKRVVFI